MESVVLTLTRPKHMQLPDGTAIIETELKHTTVGGVWGGGGEGNS